MPRFIPDPEIGKETSYYLKLKNGTYFDQEFGIANASAGHDEHH